jgi:integrase
MPKAIPQPFRYRGAWRAQVTLSNGLRPHADFDDHAAAKQWIADTIANANPDHAPELGGPTQCTLAQALRHYAGLYSLAKGGVAAELNRINHYLIADCQAPVRAVRNAAGHLALETYQPKAQPKAWQAHNDERRALRQATYEALGALARKRCSQISTVDIRRLMATMTQEGLSDSTIQKEIALLRHVFNVAAKEWQWKGFENPTAGVKLGKSNARFVFVTKQQEAAMWQAVAQCDNPYFWPLVVCGLETTLRLSSLLSLRWEAVDLENRQAMVRSKTGPVMAPLSRHLLNVLSDMQRSDCGFVFPMTANAVKMAWNGVREKCGLKHLQFRDIRHLGATAYARRGLNAHQLRVILGHKTLHMAQVYVNLAASDVLDAMDATAAEVPPEQVPPTASGCAAEHIKRRRSARLPGRAAATGGAAHADARCASAKPTTGRSAGSAAAQTPKATPAADPSVAAVVASRHQGGLTAGVAQPPPPGADAIPSGQSANVIPFRPRRAA